MLIPPTATENGDEQWSLLLSQLTYGVHDDVLGAVYALERCGLF